VSDDVNEMNSNTKMSSRLLTVSEVAELFGVSAKTVSRWAREGKLASVRTLGGHRRFRESYINSLLDELHPDE